MKVAIIGSRKFENLKIEKILENIPKGCTTIVSGGAIGVDSYAKKVAKILGLPIKEFLPDYNKYGKLAPIKRNTQIVEYSDEILAFWDYESKGTRNTILQCLDLNKPVKIIPIK